MSSWASTVKALELLKEDYDRLLKEDQIDNAKDDDNDGVADVMQITPRQLLERKTYLFFKVSLATTRCAVLCHYYYYYYYSFLMLLSIK